MKMLKKRKQFGESFVKNNHDNKDIGGGTMKRHDLVSLPMTTGPSPIPVFNAVYYGSMCLDRRTTPTMLPWFVAEVRRRFQPGKVVRLEVNLLCGFGGGPSLVVTDRRHPDVVFVEHRLHHIFRFVQAASCPNSTSTSIGGGRTFAYLMRGSGGDQSNAQQCHVFAADDETTVQDLFSVMREATKEAGSYTGVSSSCSDSGSQRFELLYVGKIKVSHCKPPPTFIDEAVDRFQVHELEKLKHYRDSVVLCERQRHGSGNSVASLPPNLEDHSVGLLENNLGGQVERLRNGGSEENSSCSVEGACDLRDERLTTDRNEELSSCSYRSKRDEDGDATDEEGGDYDRRRTWSSGVDLNVDSSSPGFSSEGRCLERRPSFGSDRSLRRRVRCDSLASGQNRTMVFQIGRNDISFVSLDKKSTIFNKSFKDIAHCSQGIKHPDHFGFICRDAKADNYVGYILRCQARSVTEEIMTTLKQVFSSAAAHQKSARNQFVICEACPMLWLHKLCVDLEGLPISKSHGVILRRLETLTVEEKSDILIKLEGAEVVSTQEQNEILMMLLRALCETKQTKHIHMDVKHGGLFERKHSSASSSSSSVLDGLKNKARRSLTSSFENILKRKSKEELREGFRERSSTLDFDSRRDSSGTCTPEPTSPCTTPDKKDVIYEFLDAGGGRDDCDQFRKRSSTISGTRDVQQNSKNAKHRTSPMMSIFMKVGNASKASTPSSDDEKSTPRKTGSWRQAIFNRVVTPQHKPIQGMTPEKSVLTPGANSTSHSVKQRSPGSWRFLWRKAIRQQILLIRMEKENKKLKASQDAAHVKRVKLSYEELTPCLKDITKVWEDMLLLHLQSKSCCMFNFDELVQAVKAGVPRQRRGDIWQLLAEHQHNRSNTNSNSKEEIEFDDEVPYEELLKQLTAQQHAILIDLGRTFPGHPYFADSLGAGQLSLFNLLKAYSLLDREVGYCQGLSFIAGVLLLHMEEENAFQMLKHMMFSLYIRRQFKPDMVALQIQMYQLSRLIHDQHRDLYDHFDKHEIAPTLYAAPWFLTLFASQFPLGFVARVFDLIFLYGMEVAFKVALVLLGNHKELIIQCSSFESVMDFLKITLPSMGIIQMERVFNQVFEMDITKQLLAYEVEYNVLQEEMLSGPPQSEAEEAVKQLESVNNKLKRHNLELLEELHLAHNNVCTLERNIASYQACTSRQESRLKTLELERTTLRQLVNTLRKKWPSEYYDECSDILSGYQHVLRSESPPCHHFYPIPTTSRTSSRSPVLRESCSEAETMPTELCEANGDTLLTVRSLSARVRNVSGDSICSQGSGVSNEIHTD